MILIVLKKKFSIILFENDKLIIISKVTDKILSLIKEINERNLENIHFILKSNILEKKSKIRNFFEKRKRYNLYSSL